MKELWDIRYSGNEYVYGKEPNYFFKQTLDSLSRGKLLLPGEGEGRNAVYAAGKGWNVDAFDLSSEAQKKALQLAQKEGVKINYDVLDLESVDKVYPAQSFDAIALIFVHLAAGVRIGYYDKLISLLKDNGTMIVEVFSKEQLQYQKENPQAGGPPHIDMLYSVNEIKVLFSELEVELLSQQEVSLEEGAGHHGKASVIRFIGRKK